jgi:hypothetical protein
LEYLEACLMALGQYLFSVPFTSIFSAPCIYPTVCASLRPRKNPPPLRVVGYNEKWVFVFFHFFFFWGFYTFLVFFSSLSNCTHTNTSFLPFWGFYEFSRLFWSLGNLFFCFFCFLVITVYSSSSKTGSGTLSSMRSSAGK